MKNYLPYLSFLGYISISTLIFPLCGADGGRQSHCEVVRVLFDNKTATDLQLYFPNPQEKWETVNVRKEAATRILAALTAHKITQTHTIYGNNIFLYQPWLVVFSSRIATLTIEEYLEKNGEWTYAGEILDIPGGASKTTCLDKDDLADIGDKKLIEYRVILEGDDFKRSEVTLARAQKAEPQKKKKNDKELT